MSGCGTDLFPPSDVTTETADAGLAIGRLRIETSDGVFVLFDAAVPKDVADRTPAYVAWWNDFAARDMFVFGRLIETQGDVGHALLNLERDLGVDPNSLTDDNPALKQAIVNSAAESEDATDWQPGTYALAMDIMGFDAPDPTEADAVDAILFQAEDVDAPCDIISRLEFDPDPKSMIRPLGPLKSLGAPFRAILFAVESGCCQCCAPSSPCCGSTNPCCGSSDPCCGSSDPCCRSSDPCCGSTDPCCGSTNPCCGSSDPCCGSSDPCCGSTDPCCGSTDPCCGSSDPCCGNADQCCGNPDPCCGSPDQCCGSSDPCCGSPDECCGNPDPCCGNPDECCGSPDPCCGSPDPCCDDPDPCCGSTDPCCGVDCDDQNPCTTDICENGSCPHLPTNEGGACDDDGNACTDDVCQGGSCGHPNKPDCTPCTGGWCVSGGCVSQTCTVGLTSGTGCPGGSVSLDLTGTCSTNCGSVSWTISSESEMVTPGPAGGSFSCPGGSAEVTVQIDPEAPPVPLTLNVTGTATGGGACPPSSANVTVDECVDLDFVTVPDDNETDPGGFLCVNDDDDNGNGVADKDEPGFTIGEDDLKALIVSIKPGMTGTVTLSVTAGVAKIKLYENPDRSNPVTLPKSWTVPTPELPITLYVEGKAPSAAARDVELQAKFTGDGGPCEDIVKLTVLQVDLDADSNNDGTITEADDNIEDQGSGKILCIDSPVQVPLKLSVKPTDAEVSVILSATAAGAVAVFADPALTIPISLAKTWTTVASMPATVYLKGITPGLVTLKLKLADAPPCEDVVVLTVRPLWTNEPFPEMTISSSNTGPVVDPMEPEGVWGNINGTDLVGFGKDPPPAISWSPVVNIDAIADHVACDQFTLGVIQTIRQWSGEYTYSDGRRLWEGMTPSMDQFSGQPGPGAFYSNASTQTMAGCGASQPLIFVDTPFVADLWVNTCPGKVGSLQQIVFSDDLETWLVAFHDPSGCYTVLKHFTWTQSANSLSVNPINMTMTSTGNTTASIVDNGPGGMPILSAPDFNSTMSAQCLP